MRDLRGVLNYASSAGAAEFPPTIRFVEVRCDSQPKLTALMNATYQLPRDPRKPKAPRRFADRFRLIYIDVAGALFERMDWRPLASGRDNEKVPDQPNFADFDRPLGPDDRIVGAARLDRRWWRQNVPAVDYQIGEVLFNLGRQSDIDPPNSAEPAQRTCMMLATRYLRAAASEGLTNRNLVTGMLAKAYAQRAWQDYFDPSDRLPVDADFACALHLFNQLDIASVDSTLCEEWAAALVHAGLIDEVPALIDRLAKNVRGTVAQQYMPTLDRVRDQAKKQKLYQMPPLQCDCELASIRFGLVDEAIKRLQSRSAASKDPALHMLLGDLLLRSGKPAAARAAYATAARLSSDSSNSRPSSGNASPPASANAAARPAPDDSTAVSDLQWQLPLRWPSATGLTADSAPPSTPWPTWPKSPSSPSSSSTPSAWQTNSATEKSTTPTSTTSTSRTSLSRHAGFAELTIVDCRLSVGR